jgi:hypothetical protein
MDPSPSSMTRAMRPSTNERTNERANDDDDACGVGVHREVSLDVAPSRCARV